PLLTAPTADVVSGRSRLRSLERVLSHRRRLTTGALLVGPDDEVERAAGLDVRLLRGIQDLEGRQDAEDPVEVSPGRLGVEVRPGDDWGRCRIASGSANEQVRSEEHTSELQSRFDLV